MRSWLWVLAPVVFSACGTASLTPDLGPGEVGPAPDSGAAVDAGAPLDASSPGPDAAMDGGPRPDAAGQDDANSPRDAELAPDGGLEPFVLPEIVAADFARAGMRGEWLDTSTIACRVSLADDAAPPASRLRAAIAQAAAAGEPCLVELPEATLSLSEPIAIPSGVFLQGRGPSRTRFRVDLGGRESPAFSFIGSGEAALVYRGEAVGGARDARALTVPPEVAAAAARLLANEGTLIGHIELENDPAKLPAAWARPYSERAIGQLFRVVGAGPEQLTLDRPLNEDYPFGAGLEVTLTLHRPRSFLTRAGLEAVSIVRVDDAHVPTILLQHADHVLIRRVDSQDTGWAHVAADESLDLEIRQSYFHGAHGFGDGGRGYGVNLRRHVTGSLVEDNVFVDLRHALIVQLGANGNVVGYNASRDAHDDLGLPKADVSIHGHYAHRNLIEGNVVEQLHVSDWWGPTPHHAVFRNRASRAGIIVDDRSEGTLVLDNAASALRIDRSVRLVFCLGNQTLAGGPLRAIHALCDDENARDPYLPRPGSLYRSAPLVTADGELPAQARDRAGRPVE